MKIASGLGHAGGIILALSLFLSGQAQEKINVGTAVKTNPLHNLPFMAAEERKIWQQNGLEASWVAFGAGAAFHRAVAARAIDFGCTDTASTIAAIAQGIPELIVSDMGSSQPFIFWVRPDSTMKKPSDLKGSRVGTARFGGASYTYGRAVLKVLGLERDVKWVGTGGTTETMAALKRGIIDASLWPKFIGLSLKARGEVRELFTADDYLPKPWSDGSRGAHRQFVLEKPSLVKRALATVLQGAQWVMANEDWTRAKMEQAFGYSPPAARMAFPELRFARDAFVDPKALENVRNFLMEQGVVPREKAPALERLYTTQFAH